MQPPVPRVWFGLAFFFAFVGAFLIKRFSPGVVTALAGELPEPAAIPVLVLLLMLLGVAVQATWWGLSKMRGLAPEDQAHRTRHQGPRIGA
jgi:Kef-type K+ transport system membrane component KefB